MAVGDKRPVVMGEEKGAAGGVATLDSDGLLAAAQRPAAGGVYLSDGETSVEAAITEQAAVLANKMDSFNGRTGAVVPQSGDYSYDMVGAAPGGYGLGKGGKWISDTTDIDTLLANGWYSVGSGNSSASKPFDVFDLLVIARTTGDNATQIAVQTGNAQARTAMRRCVSGSWGSWRYRNPAMAKDTEYLTGEHYLGKPVYAKLLYVEALANAGSVSVAVGTAITDLVDIKVSIFLAADPTSTSRYILPAYGVDGTLLATTRLNGTATIGIYSFSDLSAYAAYVLVKYTKSS